MVVFNMFVQGGSMLQMYIKAGPNNVNTHRVDSCRVNTGRFFGLRRKFLAQS